jgi:hypothetical protein
MASQALTASIAAPGFFGLNIQESSVSLSSGFALEAFNCVIDKFGRIGARRGWTPVNEIDSSDPLEGNPIEFIFEVTEPNASFLLSAGNNKLFSGTTNLTEEVVNEADNSGPRSYTITANNWQGAALPYGEGRDAAVHGYLVQAGHTPLIWHELPEASGGPHDHDSGTFGFVELGEAGTLPVGYTALEFQPNCVLAAYGRIWMADIAGDRQTVYFSRLLDGSDFTGGDSGYLSLGEVFPNNDRIVALAAHNGFLIVFGQNNIAVYANPIDVTELTLADFIPRVGCIARDSVQNTGTDIVFLSDSGVRSLQRVVIEKSLPMRDISKNVRDDLMSNVASGNPDNIKSIYYERDAFYLLSLPVTGYIYCFDMRTTLQDGAARVTIWTQLKPSAFCVTNAKDLLIGKEDYIGKYFGFSDNGEQYRMSYYTNYFDFEQPTQEKIMKQLGFVVIGGSEINLSIKWGFDYTENFLSETRSLDNDSVSEYNIDEYDIAEYSGGIVLEQFKIQAGGRGSVIQVGLETDIDGGPLSIQRIDCYLKQGKQV